MAQCGTCRFFGLLEDGNEDFRGKCAKNKIKPYAYAECVCGDYDYDTKRGYDDDLDEYLFKNHQIKSGCCSSVESLKYQIAREVAEKMISQFHIPIQYISQEEQRKRMDKTNIDVTKLF